jgi:SAM-dependent methyltransferase
MSALTQWLDRILYPAYDDNWDDKLLRESILRRLEPNMEVLDLGAGAGRVAQMNFRGLVRRVAGLDPDSRVANNPYLDEAHVGRGDRLPFANERFDLVFCDNVLEHVEEPGAVLEEVARVLRPGGWFLAKTPNRTHYMTLAARCTPTLFHRFINRLRGRPVADTFPTLYRINTPSAVQQCAARCGLEVLRVDLVEGRPEYLRFSTPTYFAGWLYERVVNITERLSRFRIVMLLELRKPARI